MTDLRDRLVNAMEEAEREAWDSLTRYKFQMFGYWAAAWMHLNRVGRFKKPNPFRSVVAEARRVEASKECACYHDEGCLYECALGPESTGKSVHQHEEDPCAVHPEVRMVEMPS